MPKTVLCFTHTANLILSGVLKHFPGNCQKKQPSHFVPKRGNRQKNPHILFQKEASQKLARINPGRPIFPHRNEKWVISRQKLF